MTDKEYVLETLKKIGLFIAKDVQANAENMTGTELNAEDMYIPDFKAAVMKMNMLDRPIGFVCKSSAGRVVKLLQNYDSTIYTGEPEEYPALFGFVWSKDPLKAKPFIALSTSPYMIGDCCSEDGVIYISKIDKNVWSPTDYAEGWDMYIPPIIEDEIIE